VFNGSVNEVGPNFKIANATRLNPHAVMTKFKMRFNIVHPFPILETFVWRYSDTDSKLLQ